MNAPVPLQALQTLANTAAAPDDPTVLGRLRATLDNAAVGLVVYDAAGAIVNANPAAEALLGLPSASSAPVVIDPQWHPVDSEGREAPDAEHPALSTLRTGDPVRDAVLVRRGSDGSQRWLLVNTNTLPHADGSRGVVCSFVDITAERLLELQLSEQSRRLRTLFDLSPIGLSLYDIDRGVTVDCNQAMSRITGYPRDEILAGIPARGDAGDHPPHRERWEARAQAGQPFGPLETSIRQRSGEPVEVVISGAGTREPGGARMAWLLVQDVSERKNAERALFAAARLDGLTGLPNRTVMSNHLEAMVERKRSDPSFGFAVLFLDFDRFKLINDTLGHDAGDELLRSISSRLLSALSTWTGGRDPTGHALTNAGTECADNWLVARFGGDEFVILAPGMHDATAASEFATHLLRALSPAHPIKGMQIMSSASIGIAFGTPDTLDGVALLRSADTAMYEAKRRGRRTYAFFDAAVYERLTRTLHVEEALQRAQTLAQLRLHYQPIIDLETGMPSSAEALLRWMHPTLGAVSPAEFIPIAEENGLIVELGRWALFESCAAWSRWQREVPQASPRSISVNLSRVQLKEGTQLLALVREVLEAHQMPAEALQLEITEREVMQDPDATLILIESLRGLGVRIAMDDFGTGASSLACLREYPFDTVKIDKSFVTDLCADPQVMTVAHATVSVIENLGMTSVAEGIEQPAEVAALQAIGCRYGQGYLFARPMEEAALLKFFAERSAQAAGSGN